MAEEVNSPEYNPILCPQCGGRAKVMQYFRKVKLAYRTANGRLQGDGRKVLEESIYYGGHGSGDNQQVELTCIACSHAWHERLKLKKATIEERVLEVLEWATRNGGLVIHDPMHKQAMRLLEELKKGT